MANKQIWNELLYKKANLLTVYTLKERAFERTHIITVIKFILLHRNISCKILNSDTEKRFQFLGNMTSCVCYFLLTWEMENENGEDGQGVDVYDWYNVSENRIWLVLRMFHTISHNYKPMTMNMT